MRIYGCVWVEGLPRTRGSFSRALKASSTSILKYAFEPLLACVPAGKNFRYLNFGWGFEEYLQD